MTVNKLNRIPSKLFDSENACQKTPSERKPAVIKCKKLGCDLSCQSVGYDIISHKSNVFLIDVTQLIKNFSIKINK